MVERFIPHDEYREWRLPGGQTLVLCGACELEEFMVPGGWGWRLGLQTTRLPIRELQLIKMVPAPVVGKDKFCPQCNLRLAFLEVAVASTEESET
jgi:hypothetical protein